MTRAVNGDSSRKTRLHAETGAMIDLAGLLYAPRALSEAVCRKVAGRIAQQPWLSYRAIKCLDQLIGQDWSMLEFGCGMSTLWLARRCGFIYSVEHDP